jgi:hypothetical protein
MQDTKSGLLASTGIATVVKERLKDRAPDTAETPVLSADFTEASNSTAPVVTPPDNGMAPKTSWSMHMLAEVFDAYFKIRCRGLENAAIDDPHYTYDRMEDGKAASLSYTLHYPVPDRFEGQPVLHDLVSSQLHFRDRLVRAAKHAEILGLAVNLKVLEGDIFSLCIEADSKQGLIDLLKAMQEVEPTFHVGPLDYYQRKVDFSGNKDARATAYFVAMARGEYEIELAEERGGNKYDLIGFWPSVPLFGKDAETIAAGIGGQVLSPYSLADIELTYARERKVPPPHHLRGTAMAAGIQ